LRREVKVFSSYAALIAVAEVVTTFLDPMFGLLAHSVILVSLLALPAFWRGNPSSGLFLSLSLAPLIRIVSLSLPLSYLPRYSWFVVASAPIFAATFALMRVQGWRFADVGFTIRRPLTQACVALSGVPFGVVEYHILRPEPLAHGLSALGLALLAAALVVSTGFVEELVFRGVMLKSAIEALGDRLGVVGVSAVFASLHVGWLSALDVLFVFTVGVFFAISALKTGSLVGVSLSHGVTNVLLFLLMPSVSQGL
jgi:membrane protease YdiL (CAAX protease family)